MRRRAAALVPSSALLWGPRHALTEETALRNPDARRVVAAAVRYADAARHRPRTPGQARRPRVLVARDRLLGTGLLLPLRQSRLERDNVSARHPDAAAGRRAGERLRRGRARSELHVSRRPPAAPRFHCRHPPHKKT